MHGFYAIVISSELPTMHRVHIKKKHFPLELFNHEWDPIFWFSASCPALPVCCVSLNVFLLEECCLLHLSVPVGDCVCDSVYFVSVCLFCHSVCLSLTKHSVFIDRKAQKAKHVEHIEYIFHKSPREFYKRLNHQLCLMPADSDNKQHYKYHCSSTNIYKWMTLIFMVDFRRSLLTLCLLFSVDDVHGLDQGCGSVL